MDPLSIITAVASISKAVSSTSITLYTFINETKHVDQTVKDLATEVEALTRIFTDVQVVLESPTVVAAEKRASADDNKQLWQTLYGSLEECQITVARLDLVLDTVRKKRSNWATQAFRQVKLNLGKDELNSLRAQIHTHCIALKMALQMVNIRAAYLAPVVILDDLSPRIETLQTSLDFLTTSLEEQRKEVTRLPSKSSKADSTNTKKLQKLAREMLSAATTVQGSTVAGGSVYGDPISNQTLLRTMNWIPDPVFSEHASSATTMTPSRENRLVFSNRAGATSELTELPDDPDFANSDSDEEFEFDVVQRLLDKGKKSFDILEYVEAVACLQEGVVRSNRLPSSWRGKLDLAEVPLMIATCKFHLGELSRAEKDLLILVQQESLSDQDAIRACQMSHLLSQLFLTKNELVAAENHCKRSLKGRRRLLGKEHPDYFASLFLLSEICTLRGKKEEADVYRDMVPPKYAKPESRAPGDESDLSPSVVVADSIYHARLQGKIESENHHKTEASQFAAGMDTTKMPQRIQPDSTQQAQTTHSSNNVYAMEGVRTIPSSAIFDDFDSTAGAVAMSPNGRLAAAGWLETPTHVVKLCNVKTRRVIFRHRLKGRTQPINVMAFSPDSRLIAAGSSDSWVKIWDTDIGAKYAEMLLVKGSRGDAITDIGFSPDNKLLAIASSNTITVRDLKSRVNRHILVGHAGLVGAVGFSPDGELLATVSSDCTAKLWDMMTGMVRSTLHGHSQPVHAVAFSPDGEVIATGSADHSVKLWNVKTGTLRHTLLGHTNVVGAIAFSMDGRLVVTGSDDKTARLWSAMTGVPREPSLQHSETLVAVGFSSNDKEVWTMTRDNEIKNWDAVTTPVYGEFSEKI